MAEKNILFVFVDRLFPVSTVHNIADSLGLDQYRKCCEVEKAEKKDNEIIIFLVRKYCDPTLWYCEKELIERKAVGILYVLDCEELDSSVIETDTLKIVTGGLYSILQLKDKMKMLGYVFDDEKDKIKTQLESDEKSKIIKSKYFEDYGQFETEQAKYDWSNHDMTDYNQQLNSPKIIKADYLVKCKVYLFVAEKIKELSKLDLDSNMSVKFSGVSHYKDVIDCFNHFGYNCEKAQDGSFIVSL